MQCVYDNLPAGTHTLTLENLSDSYVDLDYAIVSTYTTGQVSSSGGIMVTTLASTTTCISQSASPTVPATSSFGSVSKHTIHVTVIVGLIVGLAILILLVAVVSRFIMHRSGISRRRRILQGADSHPSARFLTD